MGELLRMTILYTQSYRSRYAPKTPHYHTHIDVLHKHNQYVPLCMSIASCLSFKTKPFIYMYDILIFHYMISDAIFYRGIVNHKHYKFKLFKILLYQRYCKI